MSTYRAERDQYIAKDGGAINLGIPPEELPALIAAATQPLADLNSAQRQEIARLAERLGAFDGLVRQSLAMLGEHAADIPPEELPARLVEIVARRRDIWTRMTEAPPDPDAALAELDRAVADAMAAGDDAATQALLERRRDLRLAAASRRAEAAERLRAAEARDLREAAENETLLGDLALARLRYRDAAAHFHAAAGLLPPDDAHRDARLAWQDRAAEALYRQGEEFGDNDALAEAIAACHGALAERTRDRVPLDWAMTQMNLGTALGTLGQRESGTARLEQAVDAYQAALEELTRDRVPLDWARTQTNLGSALKALGERESGTARLEQAVDAYQAALEELTRDRVPLQWATTQMNLGSALASLGERESGTARLEQAVDAYQAALEERTRDRVPLRWAMTKANLSVALTLIADRTGGSRELALAEIDAALEVFRAAGAAAYVDWAEGVRQWIAGG